MFNFIYLNIIKFLAFAFYWDFPSRKSCKNNCNEDSANLINISLYEILYLNDPNCSCSKNCIRRGNCCDDYDHFCSKSNNEFKSKKFFENLK